MSRQPKQRSNELDNRHHDASFDRYSSEAGYGGARVWYSRSDDSGAGLYARPAEADTLARMQAKANQFLRGRFEGRGPKGYRRSDASIREEVCEVLTHDPDVDASDVEIDVRAGTVFLSGTVPDRRMKRLAEHVIENINGVDDIQNWISLASRKEETSVLNSEETSPHAGLYGTSETD